MKKVLITLVAILAFAPGLALAHTLKVSGDVGVLMHIDPNDDPVATQPAQIYFWITNKASTATCGCTLSVLDGSTTVYEGSLTGADISMPFVFPTPGVYQLVVSSTPTSSMPAFTLTFDQRAEDPAGGGGASSTWWLYGIGGVVVLGGIAAGIFSSRTRT